MPLESVPGGSFQLLTGRVRFPQTKENAVAWRNASALLVASELVELRLLPSSSWSGQLAWSRVQAAPDRSTTRDCGSSLLSGGRLRARGQATLPAVQASCPPSSGGGRGYRRAHTRRTRSPWRGRPSAGWGTGLEEALGALLSQHLPGAVQEALVASNLGRESDGDTDTDSVLSSTQPGALKLPEILARGRNEHKKDRISLMLALPTGPMQP